jgi:hypothetical protein
MAFLVVLLMGFVGWKALKTLRTFQQANAVEKNILNTNNGYGEHCKKCDEDYFVCSLCGCQFKDEHESRIHYEWCLILKRPHTHKYLHDHEEDT